MGERLERPDFYQCDCHNHVEIRHRKNSAGSSLLGFQCHECGRWTPIKRNGREPSEFPDFDEELHQQWTDVRRADEHAYYEEKQKKEQQKRHNEYMGYINSPQWRAKRSDVMARDRGLCTARMSGCTGRAEHVHHKTYDRLFDEPLWDLQSVCHNCHERIHADKVR